MSDRFAPGSPEEPAAWSGEDSSGGVPPQQGDAARVVSEGAGSASSTPSGGTGASSPYSPWAPGGQGAGKKRRGRRRRGARSAGRPADPDGLSADAKASGPGRRPPTGRGATVPRGPLRSLLHNKVAQWVLVAVVVLWMALRACDAVVDRSGAEDSGASGSSSTSRSQTRVRATASPAPSVSALRGDPTDNLLAPELISQTPLPTGAGFSPLTPVSAREVSIRFEDYYQGQSVTYTFSPLSRDDSGFPNYMRRGLYPDEVVRSVIVHAEPEGYGSDDYPLRVQLRVQGESGRWYGGEYYDYDIDRTTPHNLANYFVIPEWDLPTDPLVEVDRSQGRSASTPVYVEAG